ncbi:MAG: energy-coupling factor transporter transmembrane protein EcfT, partial [candidate division Zixibacteria bacterium]|nr:energy-coupling factor transporter transmembrane protein EcfT [candidate division Zixibacteria bacterium]
SLTTSPVAISEGIVSLLKPLRRLKVPVYDLGMILFIALRFIPVLADEIETIRKAQFIRGGASGRGPRARIKQAASLVLPVFFSTLRRADELSVAIETRGYRSGRPRSSLHPLHFARRDGIVFAATALALVLIVSVRGMIR